LGVAAGSFAAAFAISSLRVSPLILFLAAPVAAIAIYLIVNPEPDCTYECWLRAVWALMLTGGTVAWWLGLIASLLRRRLEHGRRPPISN
jgi:hypothetical protein